jgi:thiamine-phosphate pyrophosphorylase
LGRDKVIGLSTHNADQVKEAERLKPDYIGYGPIFKPASKQEHDPIVGLDGLKSIRPLTTLPLFAIGGIQLDQVQSVLQAGANGVAVISAVMNAPDMKKMVQDLIAQLPRPISSVS